MKLFPDLQSKRFQSQAKESQRGLTSELEPEGPNTVGAVEFFMHVVWCSVVPCRRYTEALAHANICALSMQLIVFFVMTLVM